MRFRELRTTISGWASFKISRHNSSKRRLPTSCNGRSRAFFGGMLGSAAGSAIPLGGRYPGSGSAPQSGAAFDRLRGFANPPVFLPARPLPRAVSLSATFFGAAAPFFVVIGPCRKWARKAEPGFPRGCYAAWRHDRTVTMPVRFGNGFVPRPFLPLRTEPGTSPPLAISGNWPRSSRSRSRAIPKCAGIEARPQVVRSTRDVDRRPSRSNPPNEGEEQERLPAMTNVT